MLFRPVWEDLLRRILQICGYRNIPVQRLLRSEAGYYKTEDILKKQLQQRLEQQAKKALKKRQNHKNNQECGGGSGTVAEAPLERVDKDLALLERQLKWQMSIIHGSAKVNEYLKNIAWRQRRICLS